MYKLLTDNRENCRGMLLKVILLHTCTYTLLIWFNNCGLNDGEYLEVDLWEATWHYVGLYIIFDCMICFVEFIWIHAYS